LAVRYTIIFIPVVVTRRYGTFWKYGESFVELTPGNDENPTEIITVKQALVDLKVSSLVEMGFTTELQEQENLIL
jgi:hypothetical protein